LCRGFAFAHYRVAGGGERGLSDFPRTVEPPVATQLPARNLPANSRDGGRVVESGDTPRYLPATCGLTPHSAVDLGEQDDAPSAIAAARE